jgi:tRNA (guanine-N7-)-methyltransferase
MPPTSIRSFRHQRPANPTWDLDLERAIVLDVEQLAGRWSWTDIFEREAPVELEIGFGKGRFLRAAAERWPERNWLGIEYAPPCVALAAERLAKRDLHNARVVRGSAEDVIPEHIADNSLAACHVYFPDPWPKKRHHKRRLIKPPFVAEILRILEPGASLYIATDHGDYYAAMIPILRTSGLIQAESPDPFQDEVFHTNYEMRFLKEGKPINRARFVKPE